MERITDKHLKAAIDRINRMLGTPSEPYVRNPDTGAYEAQIGCYHLSHAYGGVCVHVMHNDSGGVSAPISQGHIKKRDLYERIHAYIRGLETGMDHVHKNQAMAKINGSNC